MQTTAMSVFVYKSMFNLIIVILNWSLMIFYHFLVTNNCGRYKNSIALKYEFYFYRLIML